MKESGRKLGKHYISDRMITEINKTRLLEGMGPIPLKKRRCLKCEKEFLSLGYANRICEPCHYYGTTMADWGVGSNVRIS